MNLGVHYLSNIEIYLSMSETCEEIIFNEMQGQFLGDNCAEQMAEEMNSNLQALATSFESCRTCRSVQIHNTEYQTIKGISRRFYKVYVYFENNLSQNLRLRRCFSNSTDAFSFYTMLISKYC